LLLSILEFIGRFHPLLVHLPIGVLLLALLLQWLSQKEKYAMPHGLVKIIWSIGIVSALLSCVTGFLLYLNGPHDEEVVAWHMWMGIGVAAVSLLIGAKVFSRQFDVIYKVACVLLLLLITATGHLGGSLTHGEDYLFAGFSDEDEDSVALQIPPVANVQEANAYTAVVKPIFETRCYSCHGDKKQKGKLRMNSPEALLKGGKNGEILVAGDPAESELMKRLLLPQTDQHHMPPKGKPKLTPEQIALVHWWIEGGASFDKKTKDLAQDDKIKPMLTALEKGQQIQTKDPSIVPEAPVVAADAKAIEALKSRGVVAVPVAQGSNYLAVNFVTATNITDKDLELLLPIKKQLLSLKLTDATIGDSAVAYIKECTQLRLLHLGNTGITDNGVAQLTSLKELRVLNLVATKVSAAGVRALATLPQLQTVYLFQTTVRGNDWVQLKNSFPKTVLDTGGYVVRTLASDTTKVVLEKKY
jgi:mono/diheme cytochrome c family protein/uncharacterized membrane protein